MESGGHTPSPSTEPGAPLDGSGPKRRPTVELIDERIVKLDFGDLTAVTLDHVRYTFRKRQELTGGRAVGIFFAGDRLVHYDRDAAEFATSQTVASTILAAAAAPQGMIVRNLVRLFLWYHKPPYPSRVFATADEALAWLRGRVR